MLMRMPPPCESADPKEAKRGEENFTPASARAKIALRCAPSRLRPVLRRLLAARPALLAHSLLRRSSPEPGPVASHRPLSEPGRSLGSLRPKWASVTVGAGPAPAVSTVPGLFYGAGRTLVSADPAQPTSCP